jgi:hypothetical protein
MLRERVSSYVHFYVIYTRKARSFYAVLFAIIVFKKYRPTYLSRVSRGGQLKTPVKLVPFGWFLAMGDCIKSA